jgi:hypothetical protein
MQRKRKLKGRWPAHGGAVPGTDVWFFLMREVERMTSGATPVGQRAARIAALEAELAELAYIEEVLVAAAIANGEDVQRSPSAPPQAVLGIRVVEAVKSSRDLGTRQRCRALACWNIRRGAGPLGR